MVKTQDLVFGKKPCRIGLDLAGRAGLTELGRILKISYRQVTLIRLGRANRLVALQLINS